MIFHRHLRKAIKLQGERSSTLDLARGRLVLISGFFFAVYMVLLLRSLDLTLIQGRGVDTDTSISYAYSEPVGDNTVRADIVDRNNVLLATTLQTASLSVRPSLISDPLRAAKGLVEIFSDLTYGDVLQKLQSEKNFVRIKRNVLPGEQFDVLGLGEPGLIFEYEDRRVYPQGGLFSHLVGYTNIDTLGQSGIERSFNGLLAKGKETLTLTLDVRLQHIMHREIARVMDEFNALAGFGVIMDVRSGEVLAGVSLPDFDPHNPGKANDMQLFNRLTLGAYEFGSVFKIFSTAALFETLNVPMSTSFDVSEPIKVGRFTIRDYRAKNMVMTVPEVFMYSSNIGSAMIGRAVGGHALKDFYSDLGLLTKLDFEIKEMAKPKVPNPWNDVSTLTVSYGHGLSTTSMQLVSAVSSIVNGGYLVKPKLILDNSKQLMENSKNNQYVQVVSEQTAHRMRQLLRLAVTDGTGKNADVSGYRVGGKTGTAEKVGAHGYDRKRLMSSFVGVFPVDSPRYAVFVAIDEPKGHKGSFGYATAGWTAAPAVSRVIMSMATILGIKPQILTVDQDLGSSLKHYISSKEK